uniref:glucuronosyltransferase n=1 Tax=Steinernema glaseri TaxID=37863 RepID=A0A1I7Y4G3_9BILA
MKGTVLIWDGLPKLIDRPCSPTMDRNSLILAALLFSTISAYKIAVFTPDISNSQVLWNARVCQKLAEAGHDVTMIKMKMFNGNRTEVVIDPKVKVWTFYMADAEQDYEGMQRKHAELIYKEIPVWSNEARKGMNMWMGFMRDACENLLMQKDLIRQLEEERFDLAFTHMYEYCAIGLIHHVKIPTWIWLNSGQLMDMVADFMGVPKPPSYVPPMMSDSKDEMTFLQRAKSFMGHSMMPIFYPSMVIWPETEVFRKHIDPNFPYLGDLARDCPLVMVNSNELYDIPRPTLHKIINIGGLGMKFENAKPLTGKFKELVDAANDVVLFSFGSVANATMMPVEWKKAFMGAFSRFPHLQFIVRYDGADLDAICPENVYLGKWIPQADLLQHPKTRAFITHGGYNSLQESINAAKPVVTIPLFGDQHRNGRLAEKHGFGYYLPKTTISEETISMAIEEILKEKYTAAVERMQRMVKKKPIQPEELLLGWTEFLAEFKTLPNLVPYGTKLGLIHYHNIDVMAVLATIVLLLLTVLYALLKMVFRVGKCLLRKTAAAKLKEQ